jgi:hydrogenase maturation protease
MSGEIGSRKVLVACLGNADRGDDGAGAAVARSLAGRLPREVGLIARSGDMLALIDDWAEFNAVVCVDAATPAGTPGHVRRIDLARETLPVDVGVTTSHAFGLAEAVQLARTLQCAPLQIIVYAIEGESFETGAPMTAAVAAVVNEVGQRVIEEVRRIG